jgi:hypothetical protein
MVYFGGYVFGGVGGASPRLFPKERELPTGEGLYFEGANNVSNLTSHYLI